MRFKILKDGLPDPADPRLKQELGNDINEYVQQSLATLMASVMAQARLADKPKLGIRYCIRGQGNRVLPILWWDTGDDNIDDAVDKVFHMNRMNMFFKTSTAENVNKYVMDNYFHGNGRLYSSYITRSQKSYHLKSLPPGRHVQMETGEEAFEDVKYQVPVGIKETDMKGYTANFLDHVSTNCNSNVIFDQVFVFRKNNDAMEKGIYKRISHMEYNLKTLPETKDVLPQWYEQVRDKLDDYSRDIIDFIEENMVQVFVNAYCSQRHTADAFAATFAGHVCNGTELVVFTDEVNLENPDSINELLTFNWYKPVETENGLGYMYPYHVAGALFTLPFIEERYLPAFGSTSDRSMRDTSTGVGNSVITAEDRDRKRIIELKSSSLTQHLFICGGTGSGKTYTMRSLLKNLYGNEKINFLVIEPVKSEYRLLKEMDESLKNDLLFLTPGDETLFPMRLNILEPIIPDRPLISHISLLRSIFNAAFHLEAPAPMILAAALERLYESHFGWNLYKKVEDQPGKEIPTLADLRYAIQEEIDESTYAQDVRNNLVQVFHTRINFLLAGAIGQLFLCKRSVPSLQQLLNKPVVIELNELRIDRDQSNLFSLFLLYMIREWRDYEYRQKKIQENEGDSLRHLLVIEEAHNLMQGQSSDNSDSYDPASETTRYLSDMLAEIRAYGQGVVIIDQSAGEIPTGVIRNTGTKIVHRSSERNDMQTIGQALMLDKTQLEMVPMLGRGECFFTTISYYYPVFAKITETPGIDDAVVKFGKKYLLEHFKEYAIWYRDLILSTADMIESVSGRIKERIYGMDPEIESLLIKKETLYLKTKICNLNRYVTEENPFYNAVLNNIKRRNETKNFNLEDVFENGSEV